MKKKLVRIALALVLLVIIAVSLALVYIDVIAKTAIEEGATYALGVETTLGKADIGITSGTFEMTALNVANPKGYTKGDHFFNLGSGNMALTLGSLTKKKIEVPVLELSDVDMYLEKNGDGANYEVILENLKKLSSGEVAKEEVSEDGKEFVIEKIVITNVKVHAYLMAIGDKPPRGVDVEIPRIEMRVDSVDGVHVSELTRLIIQAVLANVAKNAGTLLPGLIADGLGEGLAGLGSLAEFGVEMVAVDGVKLVGDTLKGVADGVGVVAKSLGEGVGDIAKEIQGGDTKGAGGKIKDTAKEVGNVVKDTGKKTGAALKGAGDKIKDGAKNALGNLLGRKKKEEKNEEKEEKEE